MTRRLSRQSRDRGMTLIEVMVAMLLFAIVGMVVLVAFSSTSDSVRRSDDEAQGLADVRKVIERLGRDVRNARGVADGADAQHLELWVDENSDYIPQPAEQVIWRLQASDRPGQYDCVRVQAGRAVVQARSLISDLAFSYDSAAPATRLVTTEMTYDAVVGGAGASRSVTFSDRLRNVR